MRSVLWLSAGSLTTHSSPNELPAESQGPAAPPRNGAALSLVLQANKDQKTARCWPRSPLKRAVGVELRREEWQHESVQANVGRHKPTSIPKLRPSIQLRTWGLSSTQHGCGSTSSSPKLHATATHAACLCNEVGMRLFPIHHAYHKRNCTVRECLSSHPVLRHGCTARSWLIAQRAQNAANRSSTTWPHSIGATAHTCDLSCTGRQRYTDTSATPFPSEAARGERKPRTLSPRRGTHCGQQLVMR